MKKINIIFTFLIISLTGFGFFVYNVCKINNSPSPTLIHKGESLVKIAKKLNCEGFCLFSFRVLHKFKNSTIKKGEYLIPEKTDIFEVYNIITEGKTLKYFITFEEGMTSKEIFDRINQMNDLEDLNPISEVPVEGTLLPETYQYEKLTKRKKLIKKMQKDMQDFIDKAWQTRDSSIPLKSKQEAIILASVVEKESAIEHEKPMIASLFYNRLHANIRLQSDPTTIYEITQGKSKLSRLLTRKDTKMEGAYNTYKIKGLPVGPICNPSKSSIIAVLHPKHTDAIYFVAKGDGSGEHIFAKDYQEHLENIKKYKQNLAKQINE
jgi:UPF0755 protein